MANSTDQIGKYFKEKRQTANVLIKSGDSQKQAFGRGIIVALKKIKPAINKAAKSKNEKIVKDAIKNEIEDGDFIAEFNSGNLSIKAFGQGVKTTAVEIKKIMFPRKTGKK